MSPFLIIVVVLLSLFIFFQVGFYLKSKQSVGNPIPFDKMEGEISKKVKDKKGLLYFHSPTCHNCKAQNTIIEKLKNEVNNLISIDASQNQQTARALNVMGTPSLIFFSGNKIKGYNVGVKSETFILNKLQSI
jgi:thiol-disulfide isomerase/thioredoxin